MLRSSGCSVVGHPDTARQYARGKRQQTNTRRELCSRDILARATAYWNAQTPENLGAGWQLRFQFAFLFPSK